MQLADDTAVVCDADTQKKLSISNWRVRDRPCTRSMKQHRVNDTIVISSDDENTDNEYQQSPIAGSSSTNEVPSIFSGDTTPLNCIELDNLEMKFQISSSVVEEKKVGNSKQKKMNGSSRFATSLPKGKLGGRLSFRSTGIAKDKDNPEVIWSSDIDSNYSIASKVAMAFKKKNRRLKHPLINKDRNESASLIENFFIDTSRELSNLSVLNSMNESSSVQQLEALSMIGAKKRRKNLPVLEKQIIEGDNEETRQCEEKRGAEALREIIVDGCNVAMHHLNGNGFSEKGLKLVLDFFVRRGHIVKIFLPQNKRSPKRRPLIEQLHRDGIVVFTPSRIAGNKKITPYDDRYILDYATKCDGIIVTSDQYRDLYHEKPEWRDTIEKRLIAPTFVNNYVMFPEDPLGREGPRLNQFLKRR